MMTGEGPTGCTCGEWEGGRRAEHLHADWGGADDQLHLVKRALGPILLDDP